ncbi:TPA: type 1 fimbrial protein [Enterobacter hormaechei subsp. steigerwaltii]|nr:type 1 fimbrial protein [Enterobacter hormaechei subsp. steigerwaltii]
MKFSKIVVAMGLGMTLVSGMANAAASGAQGGGTVHFTGSIIDAPCSIHPDDVNKEVELGEISNKVLENKGNSTPVPFSIRLEDCDVSTLKTVTATWSGTADAADPSLFGIAGAAKGAGVVLVDGSSHEIKPGDTTAATTLNAGSNEIQMSAFLRGDGASSVEKGAFTATTTYALSYQ